MMNSHKIHNLEIINDAFVDSKDVHGDRKENQNRVQKLDDSNRNEEHRFGIQMEPPSICMEMDIPGGEGLCHLPSPSSQCIRVEEDERVYLNERTDFNNDTDEMDIDYDDNADNELKVHDGNLSVESNLSNIPDRMEENGDENDMSENDLYNAVSRFFFGEDDGDVDDMEEDAFTDRIMALVELIASYIRTTDFQVEPEIEDFIAERIMVLAENFADQFDEPEIEQVLAERLMVLLGRIGGHLRSQEENNPEQLTERLMAMEERFRVRFMGAYFGQGEMGSGDQ